MNLTPELMAYLAQDELDFANLITIELPGGDICFSDYYREVDHDGRVYGAGSIMNGIGSIKETSDIKTGAIAIDVSAVGGDVAQWVLGGQYLNAPVTLARLFFSPEGAVVGSVTLFFGRISNAQLSESNDAATVSFECSSHFYDFERKSGRNTNNSAQQQYFPNDKGFEFAGTETQDIKWGRN